ncbi:metallophosphoesterase family protein [Roseobacteraceae bacterium NS-SX3]
MTRIAHLSDLHFGRTRAELLEPLRSAINAAACDLVVVSGDLTQRARPAQFRAAKQFLDSIDAPHLAVPGNHDVPLYNLFSRWLTPFSRYRRWFSEECEPVWSGREAAVLGLNSVSPFDWQRGRLRRGAVRGVCRKIQACGPERLAILVTHHPLEHAPQTAQRLTRGAGRAIDRLTDCGAHVVLCGHLHSWRAEPFLKIRGGRQMLQLHVGTALSDRLRGGENDFALLTVRGRSLDIQRMTFTPRAGAFSPAEQLHCELTADGWSLRAGASDAF